MAVLTNTISVGLFRKTEDRPTPTEVYNWRVYAIAAIAGSAAIMIGYDSAFIGTSISLPSFKTEFDFARYSASQENLISENIVSCYQAGAFFGALAAYAAGFFIGRKYGIILFCAIFVLGAGIMLGANGQRGLGLIYGGRVLAGFGVGGASNLSPIFIAEIAPPAIRGRLVGLYELSWQVGGLVGFWINYGVSTTMAPSHKQWIIPFAIQLIPAGLLLIGGFWLPESPRWLMSKGKRQKALKNLQWIRQLPADDIYMLEEVAAIDSALEHQQSTVGTTFLQPFRTLLSDRKMLYRFFLGGSLFFWQNVTGINAINYYSPTIFKSIGLVGENSSLLTTGVYGVVKTVFTVIWLLFLIDNMGRRNLLMYGAIGGSVCMWYLAIYIAVANPTAHPTTALSHGGISAIAFFYLWTICYTPTWNGTPWVLNAEMFPQNTRTLAQAFAAMNNWFWNFIISRFTPQMFATMGRGGFGVYMFFASLMLCSVVFIWLLIPETRGVPLEDVSSLFETGGPIRRAHAVVMGRLAEEEVVRREGGEKGGVEEKEGQVVVERRLKLV